MTLEEARAAALLVVNDGRDRPVVIMDEHTVERDFGWVFFYESAEAVLDSDEGQRLFGNAPIIVNRHTGRLSRAGTSFPVEEYLEAYEVLGADRYDAGDWLEYIKRKAPLLDE